VYMMSDIPISTNTLGDVGGRANSGGPKGWQPHIDDLRSKLGDCKNGLKDHDATLRDHDARIGELEKDPSGARITVSDRSKGRNTGMTASKLQAQILAHRGVRNDRG
jgi:hypothetical protein